MTKAPGLIAELREYASKPPGYWLSEPGLAKQTADALTEACRLLEWSGRLAGHDQHAEHYWADVGALFTRLGYDPEKKA